MKKNFFKKLSFVLALAMIVTALAPAAGVFAAAKPKLNSKDKTLFLSVDGKDEFDFNIANKKTGWSYKWTSANKKVATVNAKNGVTTAVGAGKTSVSVVIKDKKGEEVTTLKASVLVRDNIKELTITNLPEGDKLAVGASNDFNRSYKTVAGLTKGSQAITRWVVTDKDGKVATTATIDDKGVFTATEAGEYTITANAFQSKAKYNSWLADSEKYASYVTATATYKVTVAPSIVAVKQTTLTKFDLTFDSVIKGDDVKKNLAVAYLAGTTKIKELVKGVSMDATGKVATVEMHIPFTQGATYVVEYPEMGSKEFVAATVKVEEVTDIAILTTTAELNNKKTVDIALYNKDGVNLGSDSNLAARVELKKVEGSLVTLSNRDLYMYKIGDTVTLQATFHTYNWKDGKEVGNLTATQVVTCVEEAKEQIGSLEAFTILPSASSAPSEFKDVKHTTFKGQNVQLYVLLKGKAANGDDKYTTNSVNYYDAAAYDPSNWNFTTSDKDIVMVDPNSGAIWTAKEGTAVIVVKYKDVQVAACEITVTAAKKAAMVNLETNSIILSNNFDDNRNIKVNVKDQLGDDYTGSYSVQVSSNVTYSNTLYNGVTSNTHVRFTPQGVNAGTYHYTVTVTDLSNDNAKLSTSITVTVQDPGTAGVAYYRVEPDKTSYDVKDGGVMTFTAYAYTSGGVRINRVDVPVDAKYTDSKGNSTTLPFAAGTAVSGSVALTTPVTYAVSGAVSSLNVTELFDAGNYVISASNVTVGSDTITVQPMTFEVKNTRPVATYTTKKKVAADGKVTILDAINDCFNFYVGNTKLTVDYLAAAAPAPNYGVKYNQLSGNKDIQLEYVYIYETVNGVTYAHKVDMGGVVITLGN